MPTAPPTAGRAPAARRASFAWATARRKSTRAGRCDRSDCGKPSSRARRRRCSTRPASSGWRADEDPLTMSTLAALERAGVPHERLSRAQIEERWPQIDCGPRCPEPVEGACPEPGEEVSWAIVEPESGVLMARRAVGVVVARSGSGGRPVRYDGDRPAANRTRPARRRHHAIRRDDRRRHVRVRVRSVAAETVSGFPRRANLHHATGGPVLRPAGGRPAVCTTGPAGLDRFRGGDVRPPGHRGARLQDFPRPARSAVRPRHGRAHRGRNACRPFAPTSPGASPRSRDAPLVSSEVCQYENTCNGDFLIDRHPELENVWLVGGGSGHGFKHGPAVGEYVARLVNRGRSARRAVPSQRRKRRIQQRANSVLTAARCPTCPNRPTCPARSDTASTPSGR